MRLTWYGHSAFLIEAADGTRIILDPYRPGSFGPQLTYAPITDTADAALASHEHEDHNAVDTIRGASVTAIHPRDLQIGPVHVTGVPTSHDQVGGKQRGQNTVMILEDGEIRLVHLGDLGHRLTADQQRAIGRVDVLLVPVGGYFTIDAKQAAEVVDQLAPAVVIPMHYRSPKCSLPIAPVDDFLGTQPQVDRAGSSTIEITPQTLPKKRTVIVLRPAR